MDSKDFVASQHTPERRHRVAQSRTQAVVSKHTQRNPATRFVYWWNGWVIRTFHTKFGTVLLGTVGAKT